MQEPYAIMLRNIKVQHGNVTLPYLGVAPGDGGNPKRNMLLFDGLVRLVAGAKLASADTSTVDGGPCQVQHAATALHPNAAVQEAGGAATGMQPAAPSGSEHLGHWALSHRATALHDLPRQAGGAAAAGAQPGLSSAPTSGGSATADAAQLETTVAAQLAWLKTADALPAAEWDHATAYVMQEACC